MSASESAQVGRQALNKVGELNPQYPPVSKIHSNPDILLRKSQMDRLKGRFSISQPLNFSSGYFSPSTVGSYLDFNLTNINKDVLEEIYVVFNVTNTSTTTAVVPLPTPLWIQSYSVWQGSNQWESQVPSEIILLENLLNMDDVKLNEYGPSMLINPSSGQHDTTGIAAGATENYYVRFPAFTVANSFVFLPSLSQPLRLRIYLSGGNYMFTTGAQTLQLNQCFLEVHGIKDAPEVRNELMELHRRGNFVNKTSVSNTKYITLAHLLPRLIHSFKLFLLCCKEKQLLSCSGLDQALKVVLQIMV